MSLPVGLDWWEYFQEPNLPFLSKYPKAPSVFLNSHESKDFSILIRSMTIEFLLLNRKKGNPLVFRENQQFK